MIGGVPHAVRICENHFTLYSLLDMIFYKILHSGNKQFCQRGYIIYIFNHNSYSAIAGYGKKARQKVPADVSDLYAPEVYRARQEIL